MIKTKNHAGRKPRPKLTIAVDCGAVSGRGNQGGIHTVLINLLNQLKKIDTRNSYLLYSYSKLNGFVDTRFRNHVLPRFGFISLWLPLALRKSKPDVFLAVSQAIPKGGISTLGFVYDLAFLKYPEKYANGWRLKRQTQELVHNARHIITTSYSSKNDLLDTFDLSQKNISVLYPGIDPIFNHKGLKYLDTKPYLLFVGELKKTKNIPRVIEAFHKVLKKYPDRYRLMLVGSDREIDPKIPSLIEKRFLKNDVVFKGYVESQELPKYYRGALGFVSPSIYEGFGFPILEAMACGAPVISGKGSAMPEVVGKAGLLVNVNDTETIAKAMLKIIDDDKLRRKLSKLGLKQASHFNSRRFARGVLECIYKYCL